MGLDPRKRQKFQNPSSGDWFQARSSEVLAPGDVVRVVSTTPGGAYFNVVKALGDGSQRGKLGVATTSTSSSGEVWIKWFDTLSMDTSAASLGDSVYVSDTLAGTLTLVPTLDPVGWVVEVGAEGRVYLDGNATLGAESEGPLGSLVFVRVAEDLPPAVSGVRTLKANTCYYFTGDVDLGGHRLALAGAGAIVGTSSETAFITSTGLGAGVPLITTSYTLRLENITIRDVDTALAIDGTLGGSNVAFDWHAVNFLNVPNVGTIENFNNFILESGALLNSGGLVFDGTSDTIAFETCLLNPPPGGTAITVPATATVSRRFRLIYTALVVLAGETGLNVDAGAISSNETYILDTVSFGGGGTYLAGADHTSLKALFVNCVGITNSATVAQYYMVGNATATTITGTASPVKAAGTTLDGPNVSKFTQTDNRATYAGNLTEFFQVSVALTLSAGNGHQVSVYVAKNGTVIASSEMRGTTNASGRIESVSTFAVVELAPTDYIEVFVANQTAIADITVSELQVIAKRIS